MLLYLDLETELLSQVFGYTKYAKQETRFLGYLNFNRLVEMAGEDADLVVGLTLSQDPGYVAGARAGNGLTPLVGRGKAASM